VAFRVPATTAGTRAAILRILRLIDPHGIAAEDLHAMEIALAEGLNNIVEHAYADRPDGEIEVHVTAIETGLAFEIWDDGAPMPTGRLPLGKAADPDLPAHEQAEGGYGLLLIRQLARKLRYERLGERNRLSFRIALGMDDTG
jgi:serine/threonine-protein kinase RsbW